MTNLTKFTLILLVAAGSYYVYKQKSSNLLPGGKGDDLDEEDVDPKEYEMGLQVEMEHTTNKKIAREITLDHLAEDPQYYTKLKTIHKENPKRTKRSNEKLWEKVKKEAVKKMGGHSARAMQYAVKLYKDQGGEYEGKKDPENDLATWTRADWQYAPGSKKKDRYLPKEAWDELDPDEEKATRKKKKGKLGEWVKNTKKAKEAAKKATKRARKKK
jgi:Protein of unknown function (DUF5661)